MKTEKFEIQELEVEVIRTGIRATYDVVDDNGVASVKQVIPFETLLNHIGENSLNVFTGYTLDAETFLTDNPYTIVKSYLEENHNANL